MPITASPCWLRRDGAPDGGGLGSNGSRRRGTLGTRAAAQEVAEEPTVFPAGEHRDEVFYFCTACHSSRLVRNQAMTRERWDMTLT